MTARAQLLKASKRARDFGLMFSFGEAGFDDALDGRVESATS
jgi:hypothetical protein